VGRSRAAPALAPPSDVAADVDEDQELKAWISEINSAVRQPLVKAAGCEIPMSQLVEGGESFEPPEAKDALFMPVRLRKQLAVLERLRRQAADYIKRTEALKKGARDGCSPLSMMAARDLKKLLGARNLSVFGNKAGRVARLIEFAQGPAGESDAELLKLARLEEVFKQQGADW